MNLNNYVRLEGNLVRDPDVRFTKTGKAIVRLTIACSGDVNKETGETYTDYVPCTAWQQLAETIGNQCGKGDHVVAEGSFKQSSYEKNGQKVYTSYINLERLQVVWKSKNSNAGFDKMGQQTDEEIPF